MLRSPEARLRARALPPAIAIVVMLSACAGSNLFQVAVPIGKEGPTVEITAPEQGITVSQGASLNVRALAEAPDGLASATLSGVLQEDGSAAFTQQTVTYGNVPTAEINRTLAAVAGQGTGAVWVIVSVSDAAGETAADTVSVTVN